MGFIFRPPSQPTQPAGQPGHGGRASKRNQQRESIESIFKFLSTTMRPLIGIGAVLSAWLAEVQAVPLDDVFPSMQHHHDKHQQEIIPHFRAKVRKNMLTFHAGFDPPYDLSDDDTTEKKQTRTSEPGSIHADEVVRNHKRGRKSKIGDSHGQQEPLTREDVGNSKWSSVFPSSHKIDFWKGDLSPSFTDSNIYQEAREMGLVGVVVTVGPLIVAAGIITYLNQKMEKILGSRRASFMVQTIYREFMLLGFMAMIISCIGRFGVVDEIFPAGVYDSRTADVVFLAIIIMLPVKVLTYSFMIVANVKVADHFRILESKLSSSLERAVQPTEGVQEPEEATMFQDTVVCGCVLFSAFPRQYKILRDRFLRSMSSRGHTVDFDCYIRECVAEVTAELMATGSAVYWLGLVVVGLLCAGVAQGLDPYFRSFRLQEAAIFLCFAWSSVPLSSYVYWKACRASYLLSLKAEKSIRKRVLSVPQVPENECAAAAAAAHDDEWGRVRSQSWACCSRPPYRLLSFFPCNSTHSMIFMLQVSLFVNAIAVPAHIVYFSRIFTSFSADQQIGLNVLAVLPTLFVLMVVVPAIIPRLVVATRTVEIDADALYFSNQKQILTSNMHKSNTMRAI